MTPVHRKRRYLGMTVRQVGILAVVAILNCMILGSGLALILSPQQPGAMTVANIQPIYLVTPAQTPAATSRFPPTWTPTPTPTAAPTRTPLPTATPTLSPTPTVERPAIAAWEDLESYRLQFKMRLGTEPASDFIQWKVAYEWVKQPQAVHMVITMNGTGLPGGVTSTRVEAIVIGDRAWGRIEDEWQVTYYPEAQTMRGNWEGIEKVFRRLQLVAEDTVNGIRCKHYLIDEIVGGFMDFGFAKIAARAQGDLWIANQPDLPPVGIRLRLQLRTNDWYSPRASSGIVVPTRSASLPSKSVFDLEYDVSDLNIPISIRPPAGFR